MFFGSKKLAPTKERAIGFFERIWHETMRIDSKFLLRDFGVKLFETCMRELYSRDSGMKLIDSFRSVFL